MACATVALWIGAAGAWAQSAPPLQVQVGPDNALHIQNNYTAAATAYTVRADIHQGRSLARVGAPSEALGIERLQIPPGGSRSIPLGSSGFGGAPPRPSIEAASSITVEEPAVIYADGATAGPPALVEQLLRARGFGLSELRTVQATLARLDGASDWGVMQRELNQEAAGEEQARLAAGVGRGHNFLRDLAGELNGPFTTPEQKSARLDSLRGLYDRLTRDYATSLPAPIPPGITPTAAESAACGDSGVNLPQLTCSVAGRQIEVRARNPRDVGVTYIEVQTRIPNPGGAPGTRLASGTSWGDTVADLGGSAREDLQPGMERMQYLALPRDPNYQMQATVIYEDGMTAGDPAVVQQELAYRAAVRDDLREVVPILAAALANPGTDGEALALQFDQRAVAWEAGWRNASGPQASHPRDVLCRGLALMLRANMRDGAPRQPLARLLALNLRQARLTLERLETSRPPLPAADPGGSK